MAHNALASVTSPPCPQPPQTEVRSWAGGRPSSWGSRRSWILKDSVGLEGSLVIALLFILSLAAQQTVLTPDHKSKNITFSLWQVWPHIGPLGAVQTPWGDNLQFRREKLISYLHILLVRPVWLLSQRNCSCWYLLLNFCLLIVQLYTTNIVG